MSSKDRLIASAQKNLERGQIPKAIKDYQELVKLEPKVDLYRQKLADLLSRAGQPAEAVGHYEALAKGYAEKGFYPKAIAVYKQIQRLDPSRVDVYLQLADLNRKQGLIGNAMAEYRSLFEYHERKNQPLDAAGVLLRMVDLEPENSSLYQRVLQFLLREKYYDKAHTVLCKAVASLARVNQTDALEKLLTAHLASLPLDEGQKESLVKALQESASDSTASQLFAFLNPFFPDCRSLLAARAVVYQKTGCASEELECRLRLYLAGPSDEEADRIRTLWQSSATPEFQTILEKFRGALASPDTSALLTELSSARTTAIGSSATVPVQPEALVFDQTGPEDLLLKDAVDLTPEPGGIEPEVLTEEFVIEHSRPPAQTSPPSVDAESSLDFLESFANTAAPSAWSVSSNPDAETQPTESTFDEQAFPVEPSILQHEESAPQIDIAFEFSDDSDDEVEMELNSDDLSEELFEIELNLSDLALEDESGNVPLLKERPILDDSPIETNIDAALSSEPAFDLSLGFSLPDEQLVPECLAEADSETDDVLQDFEQTPAFDDFPADEDTEIPEDELQSNSAGQGLLGEYEAAEDAFDEEILEDIEELEELDILDDDILSDEDLAVEPESSLPAGFTEHECGDLNASAATSAGKRLHDLFTGIPATPRADDGPLSGHTKEENGGGDSSPESGLPDLSDDFVPEESSLLQMRKCDEDALPSRMTVVPPASAPADDFFDLASELRDDSALQATEDLQNVNEADRFRFDSVFSEFKRGVEAQIDNDDVDAHYNLGIAYKEMGLFDDAVDEFRKTMREPSRRIDAMTLIGICFAEKGAFQQAAETLGDAAAQEEIGTMERIGLIYELGLVFEAWQRPQDACTCFAEVYSFDPTFRNVSEKVETLRNLGMDTGLIGSQSDNLPPSTGKSRVSFV